MTAIVLDRARNIIALNEGEIKNPDQIKKGNLQGHKAIPLTFYLHTAVSILGGVAAVALIISALVLSVFALQIAAAACILLCLTNAIAAFMIQRLAPEKDLDSIIIKLSNKVQQLLKINQELKKVEIQEKIIVVDNKIIEKEEIIEESNEHEELVLKLKNCLQNYAEKHEIEKKTIQENLNVIAAIYQQDGRDATKLKLVNEAIEQLNLDKEVDDIDKSFDKIIKNSQGLSNQFLALLALLKTLIKEDLKDIQQENAELREKIDELQQAQQEIENSLKQKEEEIEKLKELKEHMLDFKSLLDSDINNK